MLRRFLIAMLIFVGLIIPGAIVLAMLAASAYPATPSASALAKAAAAP